MSQFSCTKPSTVWKYNVHNTTASVTCVRVYCIHTVSETELECHKRIAQHCLHSEPATTLPQRMVEITVQEQHLEQCHVTHVPVSGGMTSDKKVTRKCSGPSQCSSGEKERMEACSGPPCRGR